jgi:hypothetical protein
MTVLMGRTRRVQSVKVRRSGGIARRTATAIGEAEAFCDDR